MLLPSDKGELLTPNPSDISWLETVSPSPAVKSFVQIYISR